MCAKSCSGLTIWNGNEVEDQEPNPGLPPDTCVGDGNWSGIDGQEGGDPLARDTQREADVAVSQRHDLGGIHILPAKLVHSLLHTIETERLTVTGPHVGPKTAIHPKSMAAAAAPIWLLEG